MDFLNRITCDNLEITEGNNKIEILLPDGHSYEDKEEFFDDVYCAISEQYETNGYLHQDLYIKNNTGIFSGAGSCGGVVKNAIFDMFEAGKGIFDIVNAQDDTEYVNSFFE